RSGHDPEASGTMIHRILREGFDDYRKYVNPLVALRAELLGEPVRATHTIDGRLVEDRGQVEDFHGTQAFGYRNPAIADTVRALPDSDAANWFPSRVNPFAGALARRLCERANRTGSGNYGNVFFANSGSGGVEAGIKLARAVTGKPRILAMDGAYHGCTMGS